MMQLEPLRELYRQTVLEHSKHPRNFRRIDRADRALDGHNPLCGDKITVYVALDGDRIGDIAFEASGCAISTASASIMTEALKGQTLADARQLARRTMDQFESRGEDAPAVEGEMAALSGVRAYPSRIKCATLAWKTFAAAISDQRSTVTTE